MIKEFKNTQLRDSAVVHNGVFETIKMLYAEDPMKAGELAISAIELVLSGDISSDDFTIKLILENYKPIANKNAKKYDRKVEAANQARIEKLKLIEIADMLENGASQRVIAETLNETPTTINYRVKILREEFPELLGEKYKNTKNPKLVNVNVNVNVNDNVNDNDNNGDSLLSQRFPIGGSCAAGRTKTALDFTF